MATLVLYNSPSLAQEGAKKLVSRGFKPDDIAILTPESLREFEERLPWWFLIGVLMGGLAGIAGGAVIGYFAPVAFGFTEAFPYQSVIFAGMNGFIAGIMIGGYNGLLGGLWVGESLNKTIREMGEGHALLQVQSKMEQDPLVCSMAAETGGSCLIHTHKVPLTKESVWRVVSITIFTIGALTVLVGILMLLEYIFLQMRVH